ncbi:MAG: ABC transporter permease [Nocardioides sp.]|uniref:FtsX-like permease family protein n=1 Tax=Nocardioides sp. TaxID=35761 RepID=UPI0039E37BF8
MTGLAWVNLRRVPQRAILAGVALTVAVAALVLVTGIQAVFQGAVVGTLLGDAVTIQVRGADIAAVAGICLLAGIGVANVTFLNLRERAGELATLRALGWGEGTLTRLLLIEAAFIGLIAATLGAGLGVLGLGYGLGLPLHDIAAAAGWCWAAGILIAPAAALAPALSITRLDTVTVLSEDY